jgi:YVTN family beta-propeller protein
MKRSWNLVQRVGLLVVVVVLLLVASGVSSQASQETTACYPTTLATVSVGQRPQGVAVNSAAKRLYVANHDSDTLSVINSQTYAVIKTVPGGDGPNGVAYNPANHLIYIAAGNANKVRILRASDYTLVTKIAVGASPNGIAVNATTNRIYVTNYGSGTVSVINGTTNKVIQTLSVGVEPAQVAVNPLTNQAFVSLHGEGRIAVINSSGQVTKVDIYSAGPYGIAVDTQRNLVYAATIDTFRIAVVNGATSQFLGWAEIRRLPGGEPVPLRMIAVNPAIGSSGHIFVTTAAEDGGWNQFLTLSKGWPEYFARAYALSLNQPREGIAFDANTRRVFATSRSDNKVAAYQDGEPICPNNFAADGYQITVCVANPDGSCQEVLTR